MRVTSPLLSNCTLCPRQCGVDRTAGQIGYCGMSGDLLVARAALHMWEEPCISANVGSGTVFFSGCNLKCVFCQNHSIALGDCGKPITVQRLAEIFLELQQKGAANINLVTPTHYIPQIREALLHAKENGLILPIVYNTGSYESVESLRLLEGLVDIYLPDLKYYSTELSSTHSHASDYFQVATVAIDEMYRQAGKPVFNKNTGILQKGIIVRHLLLPGQTKDSKKILRYLYETYGDNIYISIMNQYTPLPHVTHIPDLNRKVTAEEYDKIVNFAIRLGITNAFIQEGETATESFIPPFDLEGV
ncbi:MAG: radical SAM protein [Lachnospiraceae bacterium]|nr:radical SAM protein [Lachnospiraceae bacterium]